MGVNVNEITLSLNKDSGLTRKQIIKVLEKSVGHINWAEAEVEQPIAHMISHMISGVTAQNCDQTVWRRSIHPAR